MKSPGPPVACDLRLRHAFSAKLFTALTTSTQNELLGPSFRSEGPIGPAVGGHRGKAGHGDSRSILQLPE